MIEIRQLPDGRFLIEAPKLALILTKGELIQSLCRAKAWKRWQRMQARTAGPQDRPVRETT
jgi:hypothetical protein